MLTVIGYDVLTVLGCDVLTVIGTGSNGTEGIHTLREKAEGRAHWCGGVPG